MLSLLFLRYLSDNYEIAAHKELGPDYPALAGDDRRAPLAVWYADNADDVPAFEKQMRRKVHYAIAPGYLWSSIYELERTQDAELLQTLERGFEYIENESFACSFRGLFSEINLNSEKLGRTPAQRNKKLCQIIAKIGEGIAAFSADSDLLGDAYEYLTNDWPKLSEMNPAKKLKCDAIVANPPFSYRWQPTEALAPDFRFKSHGLAPKSAADFAFLLHGFHFLSNEGVMAIILPHGMLFRGGAEARIRTKLLKDGHIDTVIGLPPNLFFSTGIPVCVLVLKRCKKPDDVLLINAAEQFEKGKRQSYLRSEDIDRIVDTYQYRKEAERYARRVSMEEIEKNDYNLNISRYVSTAEPEPEIDLAAVHAQLREIEQRISAAAADHNGYLRRFLS